MAEEATDFGSHATSGQDVDLWHHGDAEVAPGLVDFAVNVRAGAPPPWLADRIAGALTDLAAYPDPQPARAAVASRHGRGEAEVLLTAGAAEAFTLLARVLRPRRAVVVHPQFTEPEAALRAAGHSVERVVLAPDFRLDPGAVPQDADLVVVGNPTNPTSVLHPATVLTELARPGRTLVVDEAFADCVEGEPESLAARSDLDGLVVVRSLTKTWGLAGLRVGYLLAEPALVARLAQAQPPWAVSTPALAAAEECSGEHALAETAAWARALARERRRFAAELDTIGMRVTPEAAGSFLLVQLPPGPERGRCRETGAKVRQALRERGIAVRRCDTFPGLGADWFRIAVRDRDTNAMLTRALSEVL
ncbi:Rv2231c family pyridoxal phosphate-dependent protein CobC [Lipingzhangella sp. LS1_29]|uniref:Aminotransferase n=1 Tax=Lipingzhangella rawalii TaxID=2055835 RepID=A0ABU2H6Z4_9ACTN|nr:Rv2231c family pyridoxal phosphate-dependent protein CobC [Lipingzhangella rawalii]MDS1271077.1 Rv2231c family pyridoxal phosphate-dependent protein CobC [Lipingzhangella rawalii]